MGPMTTTPADARPQDGVPAPVVAGVVVVAAAVIYSGALLANLALRPEEAEVWIEAGPRALFFSGDSQQGYMTGGALALYRHDHDHHDHPDHDHHHGSH